MPNYIEEMIAKQIRRSELAQQRANESGDACRCNVITISRTMGSGARIIAQKLAEQLGWSLWDKDLLEAIAEDARVSSKIAESFDEQQQSEFELFVRSMLGEYDLGGFIYARHLARAIAYVAKLGNAIILGRGANILLPKALNIRIDASESLRIRNMMTYENLTKEEAIAKIRKSDKDRQRFLLHTFGKERVRNSHFDLQIWMDEFTNDDAVEIIKMAWMRRCISQDLNARQSVQ